MAKKQPLDESWLRTQYVQNGLTGKEIAEKADCSRKTVYKYLREYDIDRDRGQGYRVSNPEKYRDKEWLREKYHGERLSTSDIASICDCSKQTIKLWLEKHGIEKRSRSEAAKVRLENYPELKEKLVEAGKEALANMDGQPWDYWSDEEIEEFKQRMSEERTGDGNPMYDVTGEDHPNYKPDKPEARFYQTKAWQETRQEALEQAGHKCQACGSEEDLVGHHVVPLSAGGEPYDTQNVSILCRTCHGEWEGLFLAPDRRE